MSDPLLFADLVRQRRTALDLTQVELMRHADCAAITIKRIEQGTLRLSRLLAERLAATLMVPPTERAGYIRSTRTRLHPVAPHTNPDNIAIPTCEPADWQMEPDGGRHAFDIAADGQTLFVRKRDGGIRACDAATGTLEQTLAGHQAAGVSISASAA